MDLITVLLSIWTAVLQNTSKFLMFALEATTTVLFDAVGTVVLVMINMLLWPAETLLTLITNKGRL